MAKSKQQPTLEMKRNAAQKRSRAQYGAKREKILKAAGPVLERNGVAGTTIEAIAKEAGVDRATIYYYFADKGAIFREAIHGGLQEMVDDLERVAKSPESPEVRLRESMHVVMRSFEKHYPQLYIYLRSGDSASVIDIVRDGMKQGVFHTSLPPKVFAKSVTGMLNWTSRWFDPSGMLEAEDIADGMADIILQGVMQSAPATRAKE
jgi:TetR/AcrR family transcriptional regulator, cholesterol catabolism regulator